MKWQGIPCRIIKKGGIELTLFFKQNTSAAPACGAPHPD